MSVKNYDNLFEYDPNVLPYSQNFRFISNRINLHISSCLTKRKENGQITHIGKFAVLYNAFVHLGDSLAYKVSIAYTDIYKFSFPLDHYGLECTSRLSYLFC